MYKKAQAAMEFLMTYGWAILVVLAAIGALAYFGVLSPDKILPERCTGPAGMDCLEKASVASVGGAQVDNITVALKNNLGTKITVTNILDAGDSDAQDCAAVAQDFEEAYVANSTTNGSVTAGVCVADDTAPCLEDGKSGAVGINNGESFLVRVVCEQDLAPGRIGQDFYIVYETASGLEQRGLISIRGKS